MVLLELMSNNLHYFMAKVIIQSVHEMMYGDLLSKFSLLALFGLYNGKLCHYFIFFNCRTQSFIVQSYRPHTWLFCCTKGQLHVTNQFYSIQYLSFL